MSTNLLQKVAILPRRASGAAYMSESGFQDRRYAITAGATLEAEVHLTFKQGRAENITAQYVGRGNSRDCYIATSPSLGRVAIKLAKWGDDSNSTEAECLVSDEVRAVFGNALPRFFFHSQAVAFGQHIDLLMAEASTTTLDKQIIAYTEKLSAKTYGWLRAVFLALSKLYLSGHETGWWAMDMHAANVGLDMSVEEWSPCKEIRILMIDCDRVYKGELDELNLVIHGNLILHDFLSSIEQLSPKMQDWSELIKQLMDDFGEFYNKNQKKPAHKLFDYLKEDLAAVDAVIFSRLASGVFIPSPIAASQVAPQGVTPELQIAREAAPQFTLTPPSQVPATSARPPAPSKPPLRSSSSKLSTSHNTLEPAEQTSTTSRTSKPAHAAAASSRIDDTAAASSSAELSHSAVADVRLAASKQPEPSKGAKPCNQPVSASIASTKKTFFSSAATDEGRYEWKARSKQPRWSSPGDPELDRELKRTAEKVVQSAKSGFRGAGRFSDATEGRATFEELRDTGRLVVPARLERAEMDACGLLLSLLFISLRDVFARMPTTKRTGQRPMRTLFMERFIKGDMCARLGEDIIPLRARASAWRHPSGWCDAKAATHALRLELARLQNPAEPNHIKELKFKDEVEMDKVIRSTVRVFVASKHLIGVDGYVPRQQHVIV